MSVDSEGQFQFSVSRLSVGQMALVLTPERSFPGAGVRGTFSTAGFRLQACFD